MYTGISVNQAQEEETMSRRISTSCACILTIILLLTACSPSQPDKLPTITPRPGKTDTPPPQAQATATPALASDEPTYPARFRITTTSTETSLGLLSGANWFDVQIISHSEDAETAVFDNNRIVLSQSSDRAKNDEAAWVEVQARLAYLEPGTPITFEVRREPLGKTTVEIFRMEDEGPHKISTLVWDGRNKGEGNAEFYEVSSQPFLGSIPNEYITIAQLNLWFYGDRELDFAYYEGDYNANDPEWVSHQINTAVEYGVDAFSIEWTTPRGIGCCSLEEQLDDTFLKSPDIHKIRWVIFYDFVLRISQTEELNVEPWDILNFDNPDVYNSFVDDFVHFATKYFDHPQYLTIDGRPVVYVWAAFNWKGDYAGAVAEARQKVAEMGYDVYVVGDVICYKCFNPALAALFDASTTFTFLIPGVDLSGISYVAQAAETTDVAFDWWRKKIANLQVIGREEMVNFQSAWAPQYDDTHVVEENPVAIIAGSREDVEMMAEVARKHTQPAGDEGLQLIWINTWNCWAEGTVVEPTIIVDPEDRYPGGYYGFDYLEIIRDMYGGETYYTSP
jgi:hypothetical protein